MIMMMMKGAPLLHFVPSILFGRSADGTCTTAASTSEHSAVVTCSSRRPGG